VSRDKRFQFVCMLCEAVGVPQGEFSHYLSLAITVLRGFSIVPFAPTGFSSYLFKAWISLVWSWVGLYMDLALYLWQHKNFVWLFDHMLLQVECVRFVWFVEECIVSNREVGMFFVVVGHCRPHIPCISQGHIWHHSIFLFGGIGLSSGHVRIWRISVWDGNNFWRPYLW
jgi:hypothetical protein